MNRITASRFPNLPFGKYPRRRFAFLSYLSSWCHKLMSLSSVVQNNFPILVNTLGAKTTPAFTLQN